MVLFREDHANPMIRHVILMSAVIDPHEVTGLELNH
tara:strand:+ start:710 stop:817 length:108 start_codon:yes stop_codon:yes gene_type:complete